VKKKKKGKIIISSDQLKAPFISYPTKAFKQLRTIKIKPIQKRNRRGGGYPIRDNWGSSGKEG